MKIRPNTYKTFHVYLKEKADSLPMFITYKH